MQGVFEMRIGITDIILWLIVPLIATLILISEIVGRG